MKLETLGEDLGLKYRRTWALVQALKRKGWLRTSPRGKLLNFHPVRGSGRVQGDEKTDDESMQKSAEVETVLCKKVQRYYAKKCRAES